MIINIIPVKQEGQATVYYICKDHDNVHLPDFAMGYEPHNQIWSATDMRELSVHFTGESQPEIIAKVKKFLEHKSGEEGFVRYLHLVTHSPYMNKWLSYEAR